MQKQTYSCGNTPQPGDVVEVVTMEKLPGDSTAYARVCGLTLGGHFTVRHVWDDGRVVITYPHHPSRFRLISREQPQPDILQAAIKLRLHLEAEKDIPKTNWKKGDRLELENNVFDKNTGIAFIPLDLGWKVNGVEILESDPQPDYAKLLEEKDEAIRELVVSLNDIIMQHVTANFKTKEDQSEYNASLRRARLLITKYSKK